jgi:carboxymethylenebutenolidase
MNERIDLRSGLDAFCFSAIKTAAQGQARGGIVVVQEIFGLTEHVADMCRMFASAGYDCIAPSLFDRVERDFHAEHDPEGVKNGIAAVTASPWPQVTADIQSAIDALPQPCYVTGFCYGGAASWIAAAHCTGLTAASSFYGRLIADNLDSQPKIPVMLHYGAHDASIPPENIERVRLAAPNSPLYLYDAGHGFCRAGSSDYDAPSRELAVQRTLDWFARWR